MKKVYIVLTQTGTILSRAVKLYTGKQYNHASIALDEDLEELYSFGRVNPYNAFVGGFVKEGINIGTFKRFYNTKAQVYSMDVTDEQYEAIKYNIYDIRDKKDDYTFNFKGILFAAVNYKYSGENRFYCSEFVKYVLEQSNVNTKALPSIIRPEDFRNLDNMKLCYEGLLRDYTKESSVFKKF